MPVKLRTTDLGDSGKDLSILQQTDAYVNAPVATDADRALLVRANTHPPGIRGLLAIPGNPVYKIVILIFNFITYYTVMMDLTIALGSCGVKTSIAPADEGSIQEFILCFDFVFLIDLLLSICQRKAKYPSSRPSIVIAIDLLAYIPYEMIYVVLTGTDICLYHCLRLRYLLRFARYFDEIIRPARQKLSTSFAMAVYIMIISVLVTLAVSLRIHVMCAVEDELENNFNIIRCDNLTHFDFYFTYAILGSQITSSGVLFADSKFAELNYLDAAVQICILGSSFSIIPKVITILIQNLETKYSYCIAGHRVLQTARAAQRRNRKLNDKKNKEKISKTKSPMAEIDLVGYIRQHMESYWHHYQTENQLEILAGNLRIATIPKVISKEIAIDTTWNMFKHSKLFRYESTAFLRHVAMLTVFKFGPKNDIIYQQGRVRTKMIYLVKGIISFLSETTGRAPLMSLSGGTCFGELSLFLNIPATTTIVCSTYCEYMVLAREDFIKIRSIFPEDYDRLQKNCLRRIDWARKYDFLCREMYLKGETKIQKVNASMRYIKATIRAFSQSQAKRESLKKSIILPGGMRPEESYPNTIFKADCISMYVMDDELKSSLSTHFPRIGWNFKLKPTSTLYQIWTFLICCCSLVDNIYYPIGSTLDVPLFSSSYDYYVAILNSAYIVDFVSLNFISIREMGKFIVSSEEILLTKIDTIPFWLDLVSCFPVDMIMQIMEGPFQPCMFRLMGVNRLLKIYKVIHYFQSKLIFRPSYLFLLEIAKSLYALMIIHLFGYLTFHHFGYFEMSHIELEDSFWMKICVVYQFYVSLALIGMKVTREVNLVPMIILQKVALYAITMLLCNVAASVALLEKPISDFENQIEDLNKIFALYNFGARSRQRMTKYIRLHDICGKGRYLQDDSNAKKMMGKSLYRMHGIEMKFKFFSSLALFQGMTKEVTNSMCQLGITVLIPRGEMIILAGAFVKHFYFIMEGKCAYVYNPGMSDLQLLRRGSAILLLEAFLGYNALNNIIAVTDCKLLCIPVGDLVRMLVKFPGEMDNINKTIYASFNRKELDSIVIAEPHIFSTHEDDNSCRYLDHLKEPFEMGFRSFRFLKFLYMHRTIVPYGRFWMSWELAHSIVTYLYCFIGIIPITITDYTHDWFWFFRLMDLFYLIDLYLRHHVGYFNKNNIEVRHPWKTSIHFWKTSFAVDFIGMIPIELIAMPFYQTLSVDTMGLLRVNRYLRLYRILGLKKYLNNRYLKTYKAEIVIHYVGVGILVGNYFIVHLLLYRENGADIFLGVHNNTSWNEYFDVVQKGMSVFCNIGIFEGYISSLDFLWKYVLLHMFGLVVMCCLHCRLVAKGFYQKIYLMTYQIKMNRLLEFMHMRKVDKTIRKELIKHFEHVWQKREGQDLVDSLRFFSRTAIEDIIFTYYAPILQKTILFQGFPKVILKDLLYDTHLKRSKVLITGIVLRVNDLQNNIYIIYNGSVEVLGPDYSYLRDLHIGSIFGCLDNVKYQRCTLTYVAKTHCEFLVIPSKTFHDILAKYRRHFQFYRKLVSGSNVDYIPCTTDKSRAPAKTLKSALPGQILRALRSNKTILKLLVRLFPVMKSRAYVHLGFVIFIVVAFQFDCFLMTWLYVYFNIVVYAAYALDFVFWIKIYIDFSTEYEDSYGYMITKRKLIALRYIRSYTGFVFHAIASLPVELFTFCFTYQMNTQFVWAIMRFNRLLKIVLVFEYVKSVRNRLNINVQLMRIVHTFLIIYTTEQLSIILLAQCRIFEPEVPYLAPMIFHTYLVSKKMFTPFGYSGAADRVTLYYQIAFILILLTTQVVSLLAMADCVMTYRMGSFSNYRFESFMDRQLKVMKMMDVSPPLSDRIILYFRRMIKEGRNVQLPAFVIDAPYYLREALMNSMFGYHLRAHPIFQKCHNDFLRQVASKFKPSYFFEGDIIAYQEDLDAQMYFIHNGEVEGLVEDTLYYEVSDSKYFSGDYFGFHQITFTNVGHSKTYKVVSKEAFILSLERTKILDLLEAFPASKYVFYNSNATNDELENAPIKYRNYLRYTKGAHE